MTFTQLRSGRWRGRTSSLRYTRRVYSMPPIGAGSVHAIVAGSFFVVGGALLIFLAAVGRTNYPVAIVLLGLCGVALGVRLAAIFERWPWVARGFSNALGAAGVGGAILLAGPESARALVWMFCFLPMSAAAFSRWVSALGQVLFGLAVAALVTAYSPMISVMDWLGIAVTSLSGALIVGWLVRYVADAEWDPTTKMLNYKSFERVVAERCARAMRTDELFCIAIIGLTLPADETRAEHLIAAAAKQMRDTSPPSVTWARCNRSDFGLLWDGTGVIELFLDTLAQSLRPLVGRVAMGFVDAQPHAEARALLTEAMSARTFSAQSGLPGAVRAGAMREQVEELHAAIANSEIVPYFQPIFDPNSGCCVEAEALARWIRPNGQVIAPDSFIPLAERSGLISDLGLRMLRASCREASTWPGIGQGLTVAVNVSGEQLLNKDFPDTVAECLAENNLPGSALTLEVTESTMAGDDTAAIEALRRIRGFGVRVSIDDFGTGYSSLSRLAKLPVDNLKIDRVFVSAVAADPSARQMMRSLLALAASLNLEVTVEGVENSEQAEFVRSHGAQHVQGFFFGRPMPAQDLRRLLTKDLSRTTSS